MNPIRTLKHLARDCIYPGLDLHTRNRADLCKFWRTGPRDVLDAGSGNGYFSWLAYKSGARVLAANVDAEQVEKSNEFLVEYRKADPERLKFEQYNLYDLPSETRTFDEIICFEVLEHIRRDKEVLAGFFRVLRLGGVLHLCCPHRTHPRHQAEILDEEETGGHVRPGYTEADFRALLEPLGFQIDQVIGLGTPAVFHADRFLRAIRNRFGDLLALPFFPFLLPAVWTARLNPPIPFSLYVRAVKPST
ncbi:MAG: putative S-adenosylmethionine-dependent methyltransferase [Chthoniobacteraceae bacterium]|nr:putative S-adenosylmethionine-dependent methyltransferase [Chthoniobacteraceae bacterium]